MTVDDNPDKVLSNPKILAKSESGKPFHKNPQWIPLRMKKDSHPLLTTLPSLERLRFVGDLLPPPVYKQA